MFNDIKALASGTIRYNSTLIVYISYIKCVSQDLMVYLSFLPNGILEFPQKRKNYRSFQVSIIFFVAKNLFRLDAANAEYSVTDK